jgi:3-oxoacyl-[acyl-carrier protein] reductase
MEAMTHVFCNELRGRNITVNAVAPGPIATPALLDANAQSVIDEWMRLTPLQRLGQAEDVANAVAFLAGPDGGWVNGQTIRTNGGIV